MATPRMERFKEYRKSMIKEDSAILVKTEEKENETSNNYQTTSTLPMDEVMQTIAHENREAVFVEKEKKRRVLRIVITVAIVVTVIVGIVLFAVLVWR